MKMKSSVNISVYNCTSKFRQLAVIIYFNKGTQKLEN